MKRKTMKKKTYLFDSMLVTALFAVVLTMGACAENDLENRNSEGDKGAAVSFEVKDVQEAVLADSMPGSRAGDAATFNHQLNELGLTQADLEMQVLEAQAPEGMEACLVESTLPGINPVLPDPQTRATVTKTLTADFSTLGYRATSQTAVSSTPDWFYNARTKSNGELYNTLYWSWSGNHFGRFYGVYPEVKDTYSKIKLSPATHVGNPYVEFEVEPNVVDQKDLMTACSGVVEYQTRGVAPNTSLAFRHALTAVHFTVGQNLWAGRITKIEISGAINKGTYTLSSNPTQPGTWTLGTTTGTFTLSGININTAASPGSVITDDNGSYTFFMIPQQVTGKNIYVKIHFQDGKTIHVPLKGKWKAGTTKTYTLSNLNSNWQYHFEVLGQNNTAAYDVTDAGTYTVRSYRQANGVQLPVAWKVVSYQESVDGGVHFGPETETSPDWLDNLSLTEGNGGFMAERGTAKVTTAIVDLLERRNQNLKNASLKGSPAMPYNLSNATGSATVQNTANCYVISAPGYYRLPLVYGNAIHTTAASPTVGITNIKAYKTTKSGSNILKTFKDHNNQDITDPWITQTNGGANMPDGAKLVWGDESGLVTNLSVSGSGANAFVNFEVPAAAIKNGNVVIAATKGSTIVWSWHLWFAPQEVLQTTACTNFQNKVYKFTNETLGWKYTAWKGSIYSVSRIIKIKVRQTTKNGANYKEGFITIVQTPGSIRRGHPTFYQFGRKDAFPGTDTPPDGTFIKNGGGAMSIRNSIQNPERFYTYSNSWNNTPPSGFTYSNFWSMDNTVQGETDDDVVKTIFDPCPVKFHMYGCKAFTGFTTTGGNASFIPDLFNVSGNWDTGWNFNNKINNPDATIWFHASGMRSGMNGSLTNVGKNGYYWSANPFQNTDASYLYFSENFINMFTNFTRSSGLPVRPVAE